jgi:preprotein translocase subunit SecE
MGARVETAAGVPDAAKWAIVVALMGGAIIAFYYFADQSLLLRVIGLLLVTGGSLAVATQTEKGRIAWDFVRESRTEVRKVVWPTRKETVQTTMIVLVVVSLTAAILWMVDAFFGWIVRLLIGQGG